LGAAALIAFPTAATAQPVVEVGYLAECSGEADSYTATLNLFQTSAQGGFVKPRGSSRLRTAARYRLPASQTVTSSSTMAPWTSS
jgi:hypothetical protein